MREVIADVAAPVAAAAPPKRRALTLAHFYVMSQNMGDLGSAVGIQTIFRQADPSVEFKEYNLDTQCIWSKTRPRIEDDCDGLVIGGGGLLYNHRSHAARWYFDCNLRNYKRLTIPRCFYGIGINAEHAGEPRWTLYPRTIRSIRDFAKRTNHVGVRDARSLAFLHSLGVDHAQLVPCASMFIPGDGPPLADPKRTVAINLTTRAVRLDDLRDLMAALIACIRGQELDPVFVVHYEHEDAPLVAMARQFGIESFTPRTPRHLMRFYRSCRLLVGMRGHSLLYATGAGLPMLALSYNVKCDAHMELLEMQRWLVPHEQLSDPSAVVRQLEALLAEEQPVRRHVAAQRERFHTWNLAFAAQFLNMIRCRAGAARA